MKKLSKPMRLVLEHASGAMKHGCEYASIETGRYKGCHPNTIKALANRGMIKIVDWYSIGIYRVVPLPYVT